MTVIRHGGLTDVYTASIPKLEFVPVVYANCWQTVLPLKDGLPKLKDFPKGLGTGVAVAE
jgi:hypothetical protein